MTKNKKNPDTEHVLQMAAKFEPKSVRLMSMEEYEAEFCNKPTPPGQHPNRPGTGWLISGLK